jgi:hypothetical protein
MNPDSVYHLVIDAMPGNEKNIFDIITSISTGIIAILAIIIAYQQYKINRRRFKFETYELKLKVYKAVQKFLLDILREGKTDYPKLFEFYAGASESIFIFDKPKPIQDKVEEIYKRANDMIYLSNRLYPRDGSDGLPAGEERNKVVDQESKLLQWHTDQIKETKELFKKYIQLK